MSTFAHIEEFNNKAGILRVFTENRKFGDPYDLAVTIVWKDENTVEIKGMIGNGKNLLKYRVPIARIAIAHGIRFVQWKRIKSGKERMVTMDMSRHLGL